MCSLPKHEGQHLAISLLTAEQDFLDTLASDITRHNVHEVMSALVAYGRMLMRFAPDGLLSDLALHMDSQPEMA